MSELDTDKDHSSSIVDSSDNGELDWSSVENGERLPSCNGHGTLEILEVTRILEKHDIACCITGVAALVYYGAGRGRDVSSSVLLSALMLIFLPSRIGKSVCQQISLKLQLLLSRPKITRKRVRRKCMIPCYPSFLDSNAMVPIFSSSWFHQNIVILTANPPTSKEAVMAFLIQNWTYSRKAC
jgi:hypothetical protein